MSVQGQNASRMNPVNMDHSIMLIRIAEIEIFEDYMGNQKIKNVANKILYLFAILIPLLTLIIIYNLNL